jgi:hypothetical protein
MQSKFVFVTEIHSDKTKTGKDYSYIFDQDKDRWNLFNNEKIELRKGYVFRFEVNGEFRNVREIEPVINIWKQEALKEVANRNDVIRNYSIAIGQAIQYFAIEDKIPDKVQLFSFAWEIYDDVQSKTDKVMAEINKPIDKGDLK